MRSDAPAMFLRKSQPSTSAEAERLRVALRHTMAVIAKAVPSHGSGRVQRLVDRLEKGESPSGIEREVAQICKLATPRPDPDKLLDVTRVVRALAEAVVAVSMDDRELRVSIHAFVKSLPQRVMSSNANVVEERVGEIIREAPKANDRLALAQSATASLVKQLVGSIRQAGLGSGRLDDNLEALAVSVVQLQDVQGMAALASRMDQELGSVRLDVLMLKRELDLSTQTLRTLKRAVSPNDGSGDFEHALRDHLSAAK